MNRTLDAAVIIAMTTAAALAGVWVGFDAGHEFGQAETMSDLVERCLEDPMPPFCRGLLDAMGNETSFGNRTEAT